MIFGRYTLAPQCHPLDTVASPPSALARPQEALVKEREGGKEGGCEGLELDQDTSLRQSECPRESQLEISDKVL